MAGAGNVQGLVLSGKILATRIGYCSKNNGARRFSVYYRVRQVEPCRRFGEQAGTVLEQISSWRCAAATTTTSVTITTAVAAPQVAHA